MVVHVEPRRSGLDLRDRVLAIALAEPLVTEAHDITIFEQDGSSSVSLHLKFPPELDLRSAHEIAERVERAIRARPGVADVQTHLEPLERTLADARRTTSAPTSLPRAEIERLVRERTGSTPAEACGCSRPRPVACCSSRSASSPARRSPTPTAWRASSRRSCASEVPDIADVVVHTEP